MAYHLIPFVAGAVVGGLAVYLFGDERARQNLRQSADDLSRKTQRTAGQVSENLRQSAGNLSRKARRTAGQVSDKVSDGFAQVRESFPGSSGEAEPAPEPEVEVPAPKVSKRRTTSRKNPARATARKTIVDKVETSVKPDKSDDA